MRAITVKQQIMDYRSLAPHQSLATYIDAYWTLKSSEEEATEVVLPDGCIDIIFNFGAVCKTDDGHILMDCDKVYLVGAMTSFKKTLILPGANITGIRFKPSMFLNFYQYSSLHEIADKTLEFDKHLAPDLFKTLKGSATYLDHFFTGKLRHKIERATSAIISDIQIQKGRLEVKQLAERHCITSRQLERTFRREIGISPKDFIMTVRNQSVLAAIKERNAETTFLEIALDYGYYDHAHLTNEIKKFTGKVPSEL